MNTEYKDKYLIHYTGRDVIKLTVKLWVTKVILTDVVKPIADAVGEVLVDGIDRFFKGAPKKLDHLVYGEQKEKNASGHSQPQPS